MSGSVVVPAHNEESVILATLQPLSAMAAEGVEVLVAANGCTDRTIEIAESVPGVRVLDTGASSKPGALNAADAVASRWPRLYLDADIVITPDAVRTVFDRLRAGDVLAARPAYEYDTDGCDRLVAAYYRARSRIPAMSEHLWGAGAYAVNEAGHARIGQFPALTGDDLYVDEQFSRAEVAICDTTPVRVRCPRTATSLLHTLRRVQSGKTELAGEQAIQQVGGLKPLLSGVRAPLHVLDAGVYAGFSVLAKLLSRRQAKTWHRDDTNRSPAADRLPRSPKDEHPAVDHAVLTRFNVPTPGVESLIRAKEGWLRGRVALFEEYTVPAMDRQSAPFTWLVYCDPESPPWFKDWLRSFADRGLFVPVFRESVSTEDLKSDLHEFVPQRSAVLVTTNLDNDDGLAQDFLEQIQRAVVTTLPSAVYLTHGLIVSGSDVYLREDRDNAFCSVHAPWDEPVTCWHDWHNRLALHMPVVEVDGEPAWLQVIHGSNVSNRVRGRRVAPTAYRSRFAPLLDETVTPALWNLLRDRYVAEPARQVRESSRSVLKRLILAIGGTGGLDRLKEILRRQPS